MGWADAALEELGLAPAWVRRAHGEHVARTAPGRAAESGSAAEPSRGLASISGSRAAAMQGRVEEFAPGSADRRDAARGLENAPGVHDGAAHLPETDAAHTARHATLQDAHGDAPRAARRDDAALAPASIAPRGAAAVQPGAADRGAESSDASQRVARGAFDDGDPGSASRPGDPVATERATPAEPDTDMSWFDLEPVFEPALPDVGAPPAGTSAPEAPVAALGWDALRARVADCRRCRLCEKRTNTVFGVGDESADWMLVGEAPGENEDKQGEPFVGQAGKLLDNMLRALSLARGENVYIANVIKCRPPGNRNPEPDEVARCEPYLQRQVALVRPKLIVALGRFAAQTLLKSDASIASLRGRVHRYEGVPVIVTYHPAYLLRSLQDKSKAWADLCLARDTYRSAASDVDAQ
ncbi:MULTISPECIES: uracil-DNA glycosylase family protein [Burkholderia]|uniref:uracil-DNA glycosylase family protein n=1 Tax=Burkholderia TaxID=32008 RepID=UPI0008420BD4|nr:MULTISPECIES: uracil-DNA glycosylase family protein [unclassified Burkholderia]AOK29390.1 DNA polymerase [Burkholderia sp. Bp7605]